VDNLLALWRAEHVIFARLLDVLEAQIRVFQAGEQPDYGLMADIVGYLKDYADAFHHPREDAAVARLLVRDHSAQGLVRRLEQEHRVIDSAGRELHERLMQITADALVARGVAESAAATYLVYYRHHIGKEESEVMPRMQRMLTDNDWADLAQTLTAGSVPGGMVAIDSRLRALLVGQEGVMGSDIPA
jgi:hemerythrin-like domain-containing protein